MTYVIVSEIPIYLEIDIVKVIKIMHLESYKILLKETEENFLNPPGIHLA